MAEFYKHKSGAGTEGYTSSGGHYTHQLDYAHSPSGQYSAGQLIPAPRPRPKGSVPQTGTTPRPDKVYWAPTQQEATAVAEAIASNVPKYANRATNIAGAALALAEFASDPYNADAINHWGKKDWDNFKHTGNLPEPFGFLNPPLSNPLFYPFPDGNPVAGIPLPGGLPVPDGHLTDLCNPIYEQWRTDGTMGLPPPPLYMTDIGWSIGCGGIYAPPPGSQIDIGEGYSRYCAWAYTSGVVGGEIRTRQFYTNDPAYVPADHPYPGPIPGVTLRGAATALPGPVIRTDLPTTPFALIKPLNDAKAKAGARDDSALDPFFGMEMPNGNYGSRRGYQFVFETGVKAGAAALHGSDFGGGLPPKIGVSPDRPTPPPRGSKPDKKAATRSLGALRLLQAGFHGLTEFGDLVGALFAALPKKDQKGVNGLQAQIRAVLGHWDHIDVIDALVEVVANQIGDEIVGRTFGSATASAERLGLRPYQVFNSAANKGNDDGLSDATGGQSNKGPLSYDAIRNGKQALKDYLHRKLAQ